MQRREKQLRAAYNIDKIMSSLNQPSAQSKSSKSNQSLPVNGAGETVNLPVEKSETFSDPRVLNRFVNATERLLSWIEAMNQPVEAIQIPSRLSRSRLDEAWLSVNTLPIKRPTQAVARCCPGKNRSQDCVPYDFNRVQLQTGKEDYINASYLDFASSLGAWCPRYLLTQAPLPNTVVDFWQMIFEQHCEVVVVLLPSRPLSTFSLPATLDPSDTEGAFGDPLDKHRVPPYLPPLKIGASLSLPYSQLELRLQAVKFNRHEHLTDLTVVDCISKATSIERVLSLHNRETQKARNIVHISYSGEITETESLAAFVQLVHTFYKQQRNLMHPIALVSETGGCLGGVFVTASVAVLQAEAVCQLADVPEVAQNVCQLRKGALDKSEHLAAACAIVGHVAKATLARRDIIAGPSINSRQHSASVSSTESSKTKKPKANNFSDSLFSDQPMQFSELAAALKLGVQQHENINKVGLSKACYSVAGCCIASMVLI